MRVGTRVAAVAVLVLASACVSGLGPASTGEAADPALAQEHSAGPSVGDYLAPDGTLDLEALRASGYQGPLDLEGFGLRVDERHGLLTEAAEPAAAASDPDDIYWSDGFHAPGTNGTVFALAAYGNKLIAGGYFSAAGGVAASNIAAWDGTGWAPLGSGTDDVVYALALYDSKLIAGGSFTTAGGVAAAYIAAWDGTGWAPLGSGVNSTVHALTVYGSNLVVGGGFTTAGGLAANRVAAWDGTGWARVGYGMNNTVYALTVYAGDLVAGGSFTTADFDYVSYIASWDGGIWLGLDTGMNGFVRALTVYDNKLIAGGSFTTAGYCPANYIAMWNGAVWDSLGSGTEGRVYALAVYDNELIAGGSYTVSGHDTDARIAAWDGAAWGSLGSGMQWGTYASALTIYDGNLTAGGNFIIAGGVTTYGIAAWDGYVWDAVGPWGMGLNGVVHCAAVYDNRLIAGGEFSTAGGDTVNYVGAWDGTGWAPLGSGVSGTVFALTVYSGKLIAGGYFSEAGGDSVHFIAAWDGASWAPLGSGMNNYLRALTVYDGKLIAGGLFTTAGGGTAYRIAAWDGATWAPLGTGMDNQVYALTVHCGKLIAGGLFSTAGGDTARRIAAWDGADWAPLGSGMNSHVSALATYDGRLIAGGSFTEAGGVAASRIAAWDGASWAALGSGLNSYATALTAYDGRLIAAGDFTTAGEDTARHVAAWDGAAWAPLGSGLNYYARALGVYDKTLIIGGVFNTAGGKPSRSIAQWTKYDPHCLVSPTGIAIPDTIFVHQSRDTSFVIANTGGGTLAGSVSEACDYFRIVSGAGSYSLAKDETLTVVVRFEPTTAGLHTCVIETGASLCSDVSVTGTAAEPSTAPSYQKISDTEGDFTGVLDNADGFGRSACSPGDLDNDGVMDLVVGALGDDDGGADRGAVWVLFMNSDGTVKAHQKISDTEGGFTGVLDDADYFGCSVCSPGDLDGDGVEDLAVGAYTDDDGGSTRGAVWVLFMNADGTVEAYQKISDTEGGFTGVLDDGDCFGYSVCSPGDLNGDGVEDLAVGAPYDGDGGSGRGAIWVLFMNADGTVQTHQKLSDTEGSFTGVLDNSDLFGSSTCSLGDLDGDGVEDLAVGAILDDDGGANRGAVWVLMMNANGSVKAHQKVSDTEGGFTGVLDDADYFGRSVCSPGDLDGDAVGDLVVGADGDDDGGAERGAVWVLFMNSDGTVRVQQKLSDTEGDFTGALDNYDYFGCSVCSPADLDSDGYRDIVVGARGDDDGDTDRGAVWVLFLRYGAAAGTPEGPAVEMTAGMSSFPNPSREVTRISFGLERQEAVSLAIYDVRGRLVRALVNRKMGPGNFSEAWDGKDDRGRTVPGGIYFARLERGGKISTAKVVAVR